MLLRRWLLTAVALPTLCALAAACGSSGNKSKPGGVSGGSSSSAGSSGAGAGGSNTGGSGSGQGGTTGSGSFDSIWKRVSSKVTLLDSSAPGVPTTQTVPMPAMLPMPDDGASSYGKSVEIYSQIKSNALYIYAHVDDDTFYYQLSEPAVSAGDLYTVMAGAATHLFQIQNGQLVDNSSQTIGTNVLAAEDTYSLYSGDFPPSNWPSQVVAMPLPTSQ